MQEIEVTATRATEKTPVAFSNLSHDEIARNSYGFDIPSLLALTPSMIATNETGIGIGGTSIRLRGTDATRLNVTVNGVSMNNPDSHSMYWYDTPDLISAVGTMQVQRGAGLSTNGTGAFGGAVNMTTAPIGTNFSGEASLSYGSYNTNKQAVRISSGLLGDHWVVDARLTHIGSDGYIDRGATDLKSYMFQTGYYNGRTIVKLLSFGGKAKTYLTYNGVTKDEMKYNGRRYNSGGMYRTEDGRYQTVTQLITGALRSDLFPVGRLDIDTEGLLLITNDGALAQSVIAGDRNIDDMERSIEHQCLTLLLRQQPVAGDLRKISTAIKMITDIERIGDAAADIAEITTHIKEHGIPASLSDIADMAEAAQKMVDDSIQSYVREDLVLAADVIARDDVVDDYFNKIKKDLAAYIAVNEEHVDCAIDYLMIAKYLERLGDHAVNICEWVQFYKTGMHKSERIL